MAERIIDACCLINLYASGEEASILRAYRGDYFVSEHVRSEAVSIRRPDLQDAEKLIPHPIDLDLGIEDGWLKPCDLEGTAEFDAFVEFAQLLDDGEASCVAIAKSRQWVVATDDRKALRICSQHQIEVITTPELIKHWSEAKSIETADVADAIGRIERFASFRPGRTNDLYEWWAAFNE